MYSIELLLGADVHIGRLLHTRVHASVDQVSRLAMQGALCSLYNIGHYPTLKFGRPADFKVSEGGKLEDYSGVRAEKEIIEWVGKMQST